MTTIPTRRHMRVAGIGLVLIAALGATVLAACNATSNSGSSAAPAAAKAGPGAPNQFGTGESDQVPGGAAATDGSTGNRSTNGGGTAGKPGAAPVQPAQLQRSIIHNGQITLRVDDVDEQAARITALAAGANGYVGGDDRTIDANRSTATLTLRIPADRFDATLNAIAGYGTEESRVVTTQDVTDQVIDVTARLRTQQASVDRIRALLAQAKTVGEIVSIESELTQRESDLESLEAQQAHLGDLTALSTITVTLLGPQAKVVATKHKPAGFLGGLDRGWHAFVASIVWLLMVIGAILPFAALLGAIAWLVRVLQRRIQARRMPALATAPAGGPDAASGSTGTASNGDGATP
ncbi:MAG TPA: DUF4349 domain-containing protein [Micromonosporaceae bacterium]|jgi:hypothetical protein|nr:DUF4349 domain-containing protein [Micromonosporaceae bacterium]